MTDDSNCELIAPLLDCYHDGEVTSEEREQVESHLANCDGCKNELAQISRLSESLKGLPPLKLGDDFADRVEQLILSGHNSARRTENVLPINSASGNVIPISSASLTHSGKSRLTSWLMAVAAVCAIALLAFQVMKGPSLHSNVAQTPAASKTRNIAQNSTDASKSETLVAISDTVQTNISEELGIKTDEDGLYEIKM